jgi:hypothetical protein
MLLLTACTETPLTNHNIDKKTILSEIKVDPYYHNENWNWMNIFSVRRNSRVQVYSSAKMLREDSLNNISTMSAEMSTTDIEKVELSEHNTKFLRLNKNFLDLLESKINFDKQDLIVVSLMAGGPPFGTYRYSNLKKNTLEFCIDRKPGNYPMGMALNYTSKIYLAPKGTKALLCKNTF